MLAVLVISDFFCGDQDYGFKYVLPSHHITLPYWHWITTIRVSKDLLYYDQWPPKMTKINLIYSYEFKQATCEYC